MKKYIIIVVLVMMTLMNGTNAQSLQKGECSYSLKLHQNLRAPKSGEKYIKNGRYNSYTRGIVKEAHILQKHLNRLGFNSGAIDGVIGPKTKSAILRLQKFLGTRQDGYVGPKTRALLNNSCGKKNNDIEDNNKKSNIEFIGKVCKKDLILSQNLRQGDKDGKYSYREKRKISDVHLLQEHLNRLGFGSLKVDGVFGDKLRNVVLDLQREFSLITDGEIGPQTRLFINNSCKDNISNQTKKKVSVVKTYSRAGLDILAMGKKMVNARTIVRGSCWDYINEVYNKAGYPRSKRITIFSGKRISSYYARQDKIQPGDWLYFVNYSYGKVGHSGIFVKWVDYDKKIAQILSYPGENKQQPGRYSEYNLKSVYHIKRANGKKIIQNNTDNKVEENSDLAVMKKNMLKMINVDRAKVDAPPLVFNDKLSIAAQKYAQKMNDDNYYGHISKDKTTPSTRARKEGYDYRAIAENIALGQTTVEKVVSDWRKSPGHYHNYTNKVYKDVGFGIYKDKRGSGYYWVQLFGSK